MVSRVVKSTSSSYEPFSDFSQSRHFYVAGDRSKYKMESLVDFLGVAGRRPWLPMVVCCSSRDELDAVCASVSNIPFIYLASLHSDLSEEERKLAFDNFRQAALVWNHQTTDQPWDESIVGEDRSYMIVVTDACLPFIASGESPILGRILINYELPSKKESYLRRMNACLAPGGTVINMVVGGEVVSLKYLEESSSFIIAEMPIHISEIL